MDKDIETMVAEIEARLKDLPRHDANTWELFVADVVVGHQRVGSMMADVTECVGIEAREATALAAMPSDVATLCAMWREAVAERDALRADATLWRNGMKVIDELRATVIPCGHTIGDLIGGHGAVTKCGACLASIREHRATLATRLKAAIRRQTVDVDGGNTPNGPVEQAMETIANILNSTTFVATAKTSRRMLIETFVRLTAAMAADCKELREAADAYFGEDFTRPPPPPTQP